MSDFLTGLIQRQEKPKDAVRPRLPSLFESEGAAAPARKSGDLLSELTVREDAPVAETVPRTAEPARQIAQQKPAAPARENNDAQPAFAPARERTAPIQRQLAQPLEQSLEREAPAPAVEPRRAAAIETKPAGAFQPVQESPPLLQPVVERRVTRLSPVIEESEIVEAPRMAASRRMAEAFEPQPAPSIRPVPQAPTPEQSTATASPFAPLPQTRQQIREARREQREQPHAPAEPSIHVTIGRIEIRASEDREPRARKQDGPAPVMTLDDYLKSRAKR